MQSQVAGYLGQLRDTIDTLPRDRLAAMGEMLFRAYRNEKQVFTVGNGGSASTASHMAADLGKNTIGAARKPDPAGRPPHRNFGQRELAQRRPGNDLRA